MEDLIKALTILLKYGNPKYPTACEHDTLYVEGIETHKISEEDKKELDKLGFIVTVEGELYDGEIANDSQIYSFKYGSA